MKKNVLQGFSEFELKTMEKVSGGMHYESTYNGNTQIDEDAITAKGEADPWHGGEIQPYDAIDQRFDNCSGISFNPSTSGSSRASGGR